MRREEPRADASEETGSVTAIGELATEARNPRTLHLDELETPRLLEVMNDEDHLVAAAVRRALPQIGAAVDLVAAARRVGGRLIYLGAGTSGRIGLLDAVECPPTFGTDPDEVLGLIAGGENAFIRAVEGAEDDPELAVRELDAVRVGPDDVVVGLAASGRTPYVLGGLRHAASLGAATVAVSCTPGARVSEVADVAIEVVTGAEVLTGSTRLKAGTAQKLVCNMISTASMVRTGKAYSNLMVDVRPTNAKLLDRAERIVAAATGAEPAAARAALGAADEHAKTAVVMLLASRSAEDAAALLTRSNGDVRGAVALAVD